MSIIWFQKKIVFIIPIKHLL